MSERERESDGERKRGRERERDRERERARERARARARDDKGANWKLAQSPCNWKVAKTLPGGSLSSPQLFKFTAR